MGREPVKRVGREEKNPAKPDDLVREITAGATGDDAQFRAFQQAFRDHVTLPADGFVIGEPISVTRFDYDGNPRLGLTAMCRREDGSEYVVAAADVMFPEGSEGARSLSAYRRWIGLDPVLRGWAADRRAVARGRIRGCIAVGLHR
jgi:hypothetical protein